MSSRSLASRARGFTLVELMIVVALVGLLSAIAIPNYLRFQMRARRSEGSVNVGALRTGQLSYYGLWGEFASPRSPNPDPHPLDGTRRPWNYSDPDWQMLAFDPDGEVYFQYWTQGGRGAERVTFYAAAITDLDQDGNFACWAFAKPRRDSSGALVFNLQLPENCGDDADRAKLRYDEVHLVTPESHY